MGLFIGFAIVVGIFILTMYAGYALGCFKNFDEYGDDDDDKRK